MTNEEAIAWLKGDRSMINSVHSEHRETWSLRKSKEDSVMIQQAYWIAKAHKEGLIPEDDAGYEGGGGGDYDHEHQMVQANSLK